MYAQLRTESAVTKSQPITARTLDSIIRMTEAHARMHLRDSVEAIDVDIAIQMTLESFLQSQKFSLRSHMRSKFEKYLSIQKDDSELMYSILRDITLQYLRFQRCIKCPTAERKVSISEEELIERANSIKIFNLTTFYDSEVFKKYGYTYNSQKKTIEYNPINSKF